MGRSGYSRVIILAAGRGKRLMRETEKLPKALVKVDGESLIELILQNLASHSGLRSAVVATGHMAEMIEKRIGDRCLGMELAYVTNERYESTNNAYTLWLLREHLLGGFLLVNTDVLFDGRVLDEANSFTHSNFLAVDSIRELDEEDMKVKLAGGRVVAVSKDLNPAECQGEYIGIAGFDASAAEELVKELDNAIRVQRELHLYYEDVIQRMLERCKIYALECGEYPWIEIDTLADLKSARERLYPQIRKSMERS